MLRWIQYHIYIHTLYMCIYIYVCNTLFVKDLVDADEDWHQKMGAENQRVKSMQL